jgi:cytochrome c peroxidase
MRLRWVVMLLCAACADDMNADGTPVSESMIDSEIAALRERAASSFGALDAPAIPEDESDRRLFDLGRELFFDERLSADGQISCGSCHLSQFGGADGLAIAVGVNGRKNPRNAPTVFNTGLQSSQNWRGDRASLAEQAARAPLGVASFGNRDESEAIERLREADYQSTFARAFPDADADEALSLANLGTAIAAFEATLITPGRFDEFLGGNNAALDARERAGLALFLDTGCVDCHASPGLGGEQLTKFGVLEPYEQATGSTTVDRGRFDVTQREEDRFVFKVPMLRNVGATGPYFHDGSVIGLEQAVRVMLDVQLGVSLQDFEVDNLVAFLRALTGKIPEWYSEQ